jgi:ATP-dependent DNA ligase
VPASNGTTDFSVLQNELKGRSTKIVLVAFDLLYLKGYDLRKLPLIERKAHLKKLIADTDVQFSEASRSTTRRCSGTPAGSALRAWSPRCSIAAICRAAATTG